MNEMPMGIQLMYLCLEMAMCMQSIVKVAHGHSNTVNNNSINQSNKPLVIKYFIYKHTLFNMKNEILHIINSNKLVKSTQDSKEVRLKDIVFFKPLGDSAGGLICKWWAYGLSVSSTHMLMQNELICFLVQFWFNALLKFQCILFLLHTIEQTMKLQS
jgi:hypothetical protein